jgi:hypothetical protein
MKWFNLKQNKCPQCDKAFGFTSFTTKGLVTCSCGFKIREVRYSQIVSSQITKALEDKWTQEVEGGDI